MKTFAPIQLPALRGTFGDWTYYSCVMRMPEVAERINYAEELHPNRKLSELIQREITKKRAKEISSYLANEKERFFNSLVVAVYGGEPQWFPVQINSSENISSVAGKGDVAAEVKEANLAISGALGILTLSGGEKLFAIDGQHRLSGMKALNAAKKTDKEKQFEDDDDDVDLVPMILVAHSNSTLQRTRRLFTTLNKKAIAVNKKERIALDENDAMAITARRLVEEHEWFGERRISMAATNNLPVKDRSSLTTIGNLYDILTILFVDIEMIGSKRDLGTERLSDERLEHCFQVASAYFSGLVSAIPELARYFDSEDPNEVVSQYRNDTGGSVYFRPLGLYIMTEVVRSLVAAGIDWKVMLPKLPRFLSDQPFQGVLWTERGTIEPKGKVIVRELLEHMAGLQVKKSADLKQRYAKFLGKEIEEVELPPPV